MFATVLDRLTSLTSRYFILGNFVPVLVFTFLNGIIIYLESHRFHAWVQAQTSATSRASAAAVSFIGVAVAAYLLGALNGFLREVLEGRRLRHDSGLARRLRAPQLRRLREHRDSYYHARDAAGAIRYLNSRGRERLADAAKMGMDECPGGNEYDGKTGPVANALTRLELARADAVAPKPTELGEAVNLLESLLRKNDISAIHDPTGRQTLSEARRTLLKLLDYAEDEWTTEEVAFANLIQARYGTGAVAVTALGNVADSMQAYALSRYRFNLATFWSRLQPLLQRHDAFYAILQEAKTQLDFLVACVWLSAATTVVWFVVLPVWGHTLWPFLLVSLVGPLVARMFYLSAVESYVAFGEIVRTAVDLYRFDLLDALHVGKPQSLREERALWEGLQRIASFGQEWIDLSYRHKLEMNP